MKWFENIWDFLTIDVSGEFQKLKYVYCACVVLIGAILLWELYGKHDARFVHGFEEQGGNPRLTIASTDDSTWLLNFDAGNLATLELKSPEGGIYDFKIINSRDSRLEVGTTFRFLKTSITSDLICLDCERVTRSRLPLLWRVSK